MCHYITVGFCSSELLMLLQCFSDPVWVVRSAEHTPTACPLLCKGLSNQHMLGLIAGRSLTAGNRHKHGRVRNTSFYCRDFYVRGQFLCVVIVSLIVSGLLISVFVSERQEMFFICLTSIGSNLDYFASVVVTKVTALSSCIMKTCCLFTGGVIAYISSGSTSNPESCRSSSPNNSYMSTSPALSRPALPSRAIGMVVDISPPTKSSQQRGQGVEKPGRSSASSKTCVTSKHNFVTIKTSP